jgi:hypothetical protein
VKGLLSADNSRSCIVQIRSAAADFEIGLFQEVVQVVLDRAHPQPGEGPPEIAVDEVNSVIQDYFGISISEATAPIN